MGLELEARAASAVTCSSNPISPCLVGNGPASEDACWGEDGVGSAEEASAMSVIIREPRSAPGKENNQDS